MRIAFCITGLDVGGAEKALVEIAIRFAQTGNTCRVIALQEPPPAERSLLVEKLKATGIEVSFCNARSMRSLVSVSKQLKKKLLVFEPDIIQSFLHHANILTAWTMRKSNVPVITGIRVAEKRKNLHRWLAKRTDKYISKHVCVSESVKNFAMEVIDLPAEKLSVIPNGVDIELFQNAKPVLKESLGLSINSKIILYVGRLDPQKRVDWLLNCFETIAEHLDDHHLVLVGDGPERESLLAHVKTLNSHQRIHWLGWRPDVPQLMASSEMLVLTSAWEGMPNVVLEAMASGLPVVVTKCEGISEILGPKQIHQVVERNDSEGFIESVCGIASDVALKKQLGMGNLQQAKSFSWEAVFQQYDALYTSLAGVN